MFHFGIYKVKGVSTELGRGEKKVGEKKGTHIEHSESADDASEQKEAEHLSAVEAGRRGHVIRDVLDRREHAVEHEVQGLSATDAVDSSATRKSQHRRSAHGSD